MASDRIQRRIERLLDEADEAVARYDWQAVRQAAQAVLALDSENPDALTFLEAAEFALGTSSESPPMESATPEPFVTPTPSPAQPASFANGRYQVKQFLGEGGKKKVYLAHDTLLDREVAFA